MPVDGTASSSELPGSSPPRRFEQPAVHLPVPEPDVPACDPDDTNSAGEATVRGEFAAFATLASELTRSELTRSEESPQGCAANPSGHGKAPAAQSTLTASSPFARLACSSADDEEEAEAEADASDARHHVVRAAPHGSALAEGNLAATSPKSYGKDHSFYDSGRSEVNFSADARSSVGHCSRSSGRSSLLESRGTQVAGSSSKNLVARDSSSISMSEYRDTVGSLTFPWASPPAAELFKPLAQPAASAETPAAAEITSVQHSDAADLEASGDWEFPPARPISITPHSSTAGAGLSVTTGLSRNKSEVQESSSSAAVGTMQQVPASMSLAGINEKEDIGDIVEQYFTPRSTIEGRFTSSLDACQASTNCAALMLKRCLLLLNRQLAAAVRVSRRALLHSRVNAVICAAVIAAAWAFRAILLNASFENAHQIAQASMCFADGRGVALALTAIVALAAAAGLCWKHAWAFVLRAAGIVVLLLAAAGAGFALGQRTS